VLWATSRPDGVEGDDRRPGSRWWFRLRGTAEFLCQTVLNQVRAGKRDVVQVIDGNGAGLRIDANGDHDTLC
jgi:hypothetical protein